MKARTLLILSALALGTSAYAQQKVRFVSLAWQTQAVAAVKAIVAEWNAKNPGMPVEYQQVDWGSIQDYLTTSFQSKNTPDLVHYESGPIMDFGKQGFLTDLRPYIPAEMKQDIAPGAWQTVTDSAGHIWGVPFLWESQIILYNKDLFAKAGIRPPTTQKPWTWSDMQAAAKKLTQDTNGDGKPEVYGAAFGLKSASNRILNMSLGFGGDYFTTQNGKSVLQVGNAEKQLLNILMDMMYVSKTASTDGIGLSGPELLPGFYAGKYAMLPGIGVWARQQIVESGPKDFHWGVLPPLKATSQAQGSTTQTLSIPAAAQNKAGAAKFMAFFLNRTNMGRLAAGDWLFPTRQSSLRGAPFMTDQYGWRTATESAKYLTMAPWQKVNGFSEVRSKVMNPLLQQLFANRITVDEFAKRLTEEGNAILQRY
ncbi:extracellular solute-binding protein (plasmid) [Deinococcus metallilatus]|uniref:ABC-type glycerol-3-phosphate transport system substrate-binding protein n=1 Tax=Deinococcus metallilatus TaxID=1211322 RepID=A0AAJ5F7G2_9DEIO|nr:extracellular solute-binding protein [Deinococcus metallilatus]MBB5293465.1 ABC-type glycerol-3-phosphate transport system substrate-binding protein [Deinococcus metallilatus]QBY06550.1 extracellular solute-binding protein [Deinococcus metallilatus]RXJ17893.1 extracellular solute-binding protein [Deinococcus metallilatus]TLK32165.1 extracellular solute-binding protein [Deinococcus metallilatus]GMA15315.1 hypothetical protein GCM10025871_16460 [Deinococcus metallilatus]